MISTYLEVIAVSLREIAETSRKVTNLRARSCPETTGDLSSKYEHRRASALLHNIQNIRICKRKKIYRFCNLRKRKDFNKNSLPYLKCVLHLSCAVHGPIYGRFIGFYVNGFLSIYPWAMDTDRKWNFPARTFWECVRLPKRHAAFVDDEIQGGLPLLLKRKYKTILFACKSLFFLLVIQYK